MAARKSKSVSPQEAYAKRITPAAVEICQLRDELKRIVEHLTSIDSLLAAIGDEDDWATALGFSVQAVKNEVVHVCERLGQMTVDAHGQVIGVEEGGAQ